MIFEGRGAYRVVHRLHWAPLIAALHWTVMSGRVPSDSQEWHGTIRQSGMAYHQTVRNGMVPKNSQEWHGTIIQSGVAWYHQTVSDGRVP